MRPQPGGSGLAYNRGVPTTSPSPTEPAASAGAAPTVVIGGGLAGLAAAARLARGGRRVLLLESRPRLGGRATSFDDAGSGESIDNCQHVGMGCCTALQQFCEEAGLGDLFRIERELTFIDARGRRSRFVGRQLPAPLHLAPAFAGLKYLTWRDRIQIGRGLQALARDPGPWEGSFADWLIGHGQGEPARRLFWHVVLVSALSETLDRIDTAAAKKVFVDGFLSNAAAYEVHLPRRPLDDLYGEPMLRHLRSLGVEVRTGAAVSQVDIHADIHADIQADIEEETVAGVTLRDGETIPAAAVVLAVPFHRVNALLPEAARLPQLDRLESAPIASVHLWLDRPITDLPHAVLVEHLSQWVFARPPAADGRLGHYYQVVISASRDVIARPRAEVIAQVVAELRSVFPDAVDAAVLRSRLVVEKRAVFSIRPGSDRLRPSQATSTRGLVLAGDYTRTGWPATMEGAVRSGELAAAVLLGAPPAIPSDLPRGRLARWFIGPDAASEAAWSDRPADPARSPLGV